MFKEIIEIMIHLLEFLGMIIIGVGGVKAFIEYFSNLLFKKNYGIKIELAESLALALELKMGAEILKTVIVKTMDELFILGVIILLRTILAFVIHWEIKNAKKIVPSEEIK